MRSPCIFGKDVLHGGTQQLLLVRLVLNPVCYDLHYSDVDFDNRVREAKALQPRCFRAEVALEACSIGRARSA